MQNIPLLSLTSLEDKRSTCPNFLSRAIPNTLAAQIYIYATSAVRKTAIRREYTIYREYCYHREIRSQQDFGLAYLAAFFQYPVMSFDYDLTLTLQEYFGYQTVHPYELGGYPDCRAIWLDANIIIRLGEKEGRRLCQKLLQNGSSSQKLVYIIPDFIVGEICHVMKKKAYPKKKKSSIINPTEQIGKFRDWSIAERYLPLIKTLNLA
jgi:hypothetical protein